MRTNEEAISKITQNREIPNNYRSISFAHCNQPSNRPFSIAPTHKMRWITVLSGKRGRPAYTYRGYGNYSIHEFRNKCLQSESQFLGRGLSEMFPASNVNLQTHPSHSGRHALINHRWRFRFRAGFDGNRCLRLWQHVGRDHGGSAGGAHGKERSPAIPRETSRRHDHERPWLHGFRR